MLSTAKVHLNPGRGTVEVDGHELGNSIRKLTIDAEAGQPPTLTVDVVLTEAEVDGEMVVRVHDKMAEVLVALGWTPPAER